jgi:hypothetical protein
VLTSVSCACNQLRFPLLPTRTTFRACHSMSSARSRATRIMIRCALGSGCLATVRMLCDRHEVCNSYLLVCSWSSFPPPTRTTLVHAVPYLLRDHERCDHRFGIAPALAPATPDCVSVICSVSKHRPYLVVPKISRVSASLVCTVWDHFCACCSMSLRSNERRDHDCVRPRSALAGLHMYIFVRSSCVSSAVIPMPFRF